MSASITDTQIANRALMLLGETSRLADLNTDDSTRARQIRDVYQDSVDAVLTDYDWNFNTARAAIAASATTPPFEYAYQYPYPDDCLKIRGLYDAGSYVAAGSGYSAEANEQRERWRVETIGNTSGEATRVILSDIGAPLNIIYSRKMDNLGIWSPPAREALAARVAMAAAMAVTQKQSVFSAMQDLYYSLFSMAGMRDAQEGSADALYEGRIVEARW